MSQLCGPSPLVLASASPRRLELLDGLGIPFDVIAAEIDEERLPGEEPAALVRRLALAKAVVVAAARPQALVVAADTIVVLGDEILGKPRSREGAVAMLSQLRARTHRVLTGLALSRGAGGRAEAWVAETGVRMRDYADSEVQRYVATGDPLDKAGAYAIQHPWFAPVEGLDNCYASVVGLPLCHLYRALACWRRTPPVHPLQGCPWAVSHGGCDWMESILGETCDGGSS